MKDVNLTREHNQEGVPKQRNLAPSLFDVERLADCVLRIRGQCTRYSVLRRLSYEEEVLRSSPIPVSKGC